MVNLLDLIGFLGIIFISIGIGMFVVFLDSQKEIKIPQLKPKKKPKKGDKMNIHDFAVLISKKEGKKKQTNIAQIKEILRIINKETDGEFYKMVRKI